MEYGLPVNNHAEMVPVGHETRRAQGRVETIYSSGDWLVRLKEAAGLNHDLYATVMKLNRGYQRERFDEVDLALHELPQCFEH